MNVLTKTLEVDFDEVVDVVLLAEKDKDVAIHDFGLVVRDTDDMLG